MIADIRKNRNMPFLKVGMQIYSNHSYRFGKVTGTRGGYLLIRMNGDKFSCPYHPTWNLTFFNKDGSTAKCYKEI